MAEKRFGGFAFELADDADADDVREWFLAFCGGNCHEQIKAALTGPGFDVRRVQKQWFHHLWEITMRRGTAALAPGRRLTVRQVRLILDRAGIHLEPDEIVVDQSRDRILVAFVYDGGEEGVWT